jgi:hypothetical protein
MPKKPSKPSTYRETKPGKVKNVPRETVSDPRVSYVYRKDAFKKVKIA